MLLKSQAAHRPEFQKDLYHYGWTNGQVSSIFWPTNLYKHASCRCGGVWLDSVPPTLILSQVLSRCLLKQFFILPADNREARTASWHYWSHLLWLRMQVARVLWIWVWMNVARPAARSSGSSSQQQHGCPALADPRRASPPSGPAGMLEWYSQRFTQMKNKAVIHSAWIRSFSQAILGAHNVPIIQGHFVGEGCFDFPTAHHKDPG